jgi:predicted nucleotidyltransferase
VVEIQMHGIIDERQVREIAQRIAEALSPERIVLFGSYGRGAPHEESDLNLCVVVSEAGDWLLRPHELRRLVPVTEVAVNPLVLTEAELERLRAAGNPIVEGVLEEGKVIYERR